MRVWAAVQFVQNIDMSMCSDAGRDNRKRNAAADIMVNYF